MLDLQTCTQISQKSFLQRLITVAVATGDTEDYLSHYNMVVEGRRTHGATPLVRVLVLR